MIKNYIAFVSPLVGLGGFNSTSFVYSQVLAQVLSGAFCMAEQCRRGEKQGQIDLQAAGMSIKT